jgi:hypothetical protein
MKTRNLLISVALAALFALPVYAAAPHDCAVHCATHTDKEANMCLNHCKGDPAASTHDCAKHCAAQPGDKDHACALHCKK